MKQTEKLRMRISFPLMLELKAVSNEEQITLTEAARRVLVDWSARRAMSRGAVGTVLPNTEDRK